MLKEITFLLFLLDIQISSGYHFVTEENDDCPHIQVQYIRHTLLYDADNTTDGKLVDCLLKKIQQSQSMLLLRGLQEQSPKKQITTNQPNVVILTGDLDQDFLDDPSLLVLFKSHWNFLYIIVTSNETNFTCINGKFEDNGFFQIQTILNNLWHKYTLIRLIAIFPISCPNVYVIYGGQTMTNNSLYDRTIQVVQPKTDIELFQYIDDNSKGLTEGYPLIVTMFERFPTSINVCDKIHYYVPYNKNVTDGFCGADGLIMQDTFKHYKFKTTFSREKKCDRYGYMNRVNGEVTGSLGCAINGEIDVSFNSRFMVPYTDEKFNYLYFTSHDSLCAILPIPVPYPLWHYPIHAFDWIVCCLIFTIIFIAAIVTKIIEYLKNNPNRENSFRNFLYDYFTCTLLGFSVRRKPNYYLLRGSCLCGSIVFLAMYQGYINFRFTTVTRHSKLKTLQELYATNNVLYTSKAVRDLLRPLENPNNTMQVAFLEKIKFRLRTDIGITLKVKNSVSLGRKKDVNIEISLKYLSKYGTPLLYQIDQCFGSYYLTYIARFGFPFSKELRIFMQRLLEAGLPSMYYSWTSRTLGHADTPVDQIVETRRIAKITMKDQRVAFCFLLFGYAIATITFIFEKFR